MHLLGHSTGSGPYLPPYNGSVALRPQRNVAEDRGQPSLRLAEGEIWTQSCALEGVMSGSRGEGSSPPALLANQQQDAMAWLLLGSELLVWAPPEAEVCAGAWGCAVQLLLGGSNRSEA